MIEKLVFAGDDHLKEVLDLALRGVVGSPVKPDCWQSGSDERGPYFRLGKSYDRTPQDWQRFPVELDASAILPLAEQWLGAAEYGPEPDTDGSVEKGFQLDTDGAGGWDPVLLTLRPYWTTYGK